MSNLKAILVFVQFRKERHNLIQQAKFTPVEQLIETKNVRKTTFKLQLKQ